MAGLVNLWSLIATLVVLSQAVPQGVVLDSEVVDVVEEVTSKRSADDREYKFKAFGKEIDLKLHRTKDLLPENLLVLVNGEDEDGNPTTDDWTHRTDGPQSLYSDRTNGASIMIDETFGEPKLNGMIGDNLVIEPVEDITLNADDTVEKREPTKKLRHVIYKVQPQKVKDTKDDFVVLADRKVDTDTREKRAVPSQIYVTVHVVVDYSLWKKLDRTEDEVIRYIKIFYNQVNQLYSQMTQPKVSVSIQGITILKSAQASAVVENSRLGTKSVVSKDALDDISKYAYDQRSRTGTDYGLMMVMTDYDLCSPENGICQPNNAGLAYVGTVCDGYRFSKTSKTGIAEDHGAFDGVKTVAHEMGHILGMNHDGDGPARSGAPGARGCRSSDNYIMGDTAFKLNQFIFSSCSVEQLRWLTMQSSAKCLLQKPSSSPYPLINKLPGKEMDLDNQCKVIYGASSGVGCRLPGVNSGNDEICLGLMCKTSSRSCNSQTAAAEGSYCGPQRYCRQGKCVCDPTAPLPTAPPEDPSCTADNPRIRINGKSCTDLLSTPKGLESCQDNSVKTYCCKSRTKYCRATPITCDGSSVPTTTPEPFNPDSTTRRTTQRTTQRTTTTKRPVVTRPPVVDDCGKNCEDTPRIRINGQTCSSVLATSSAKRSLCDNPTVIEHCCATRDKVCNGYHWITDSCDPQCQDNPGMRINGLQCVPFLSSSSNRRNFCDHDLIRGNCCASRAKLCF